MSRSEKLLIEQLKLGNKDVFGQIFSQYYKDLCRLAFAYVKNYEVGEEIVQDIFVKIWNQHEVINISSTIIAYLHTAVKNTCINYLKTLKVRENYAEVVKRENTTTTNSTFDTLEQVELEKKIDDSIESLPEQWKEVFKMNRFDGLKYREIAEKLNISQKTVEAYMTRSLQQLRDQLKEYLP